MLIAALLGVVNVTGTDMQNAAKVAAAAADTSRTYTIHHEVDPISLFGSWDFILMLYPTLFPYGRGSPSAKRSPQMSIAAWVEHCLSLHHRRHARHKSFLFVLFGIFTLSIVVLYFL